MRRLPVVLALAMLGTASAAKTTKPQLALSPQLIKRTVLCTLAVQNACQMLSMRYSRLPSQPAYLSSTAVVMAEAMKVEAATVAATLTAREEEVPACVEK